MPSTRWTMNKMESQAQLSRQHPPCRFSDAKPSNFNTPHEGVVTECPSTGLPINILESNTIEGAPVLEGIPEEANGIGDPRKTTETDSRSPLATAYACRRSIPGKIWTSTNQITATPARAHVSRELRARAPGHLGVYKEGRVAYRAIRVRVS